MYDEGEPTEAEIREAKLKVILDSQAFKNRMHPKHAYSMAMFRRLHDVELPSDAKLLDSQDDDCELDELRKNPAFADPLHPDHKAVMQQFRELHGIE